MILHIVTVISSLSIYPFLAEKYYLKEVNCLSITDKTRSSHLCVFVSYGLVKYAEWMLDVTVCCEEIRKDINTRSMKSEQVRKNT